MEYLNNKRTEVKKLIENDEENINNFMIHEKINLISEKYKNINNMKKIILEYPNVFVKNAFFSKELKNNLEKTEHTFTDIYTNYENLSTLFKTESYEKEFTNLKNFVELKDTISTESNTNILENIFKLPLLLHQNNEKQNLQECIECIHIATSVRQALHHWYMDKLNEEKEEKLKEKKSKSTAESKSKPNSELDSELELEMDSHEQSYVQKKKEEKQMEMDTENTRCTTKENVLFFKSYEKCLKEEIEKTKNILFHEIKKTENVSTLKKLIFYLEEIHNYYIGVNRDDSETNVTKDTKMEICIKESFLWIKHYDILDTINEELHKGVITIYKTVQLFLKKIIHLKNIYKQLFEEEDQYICKHITFLYYFLFTLLHFKMKFQKEWYNSNHLKKEKDDTYFLQFCNAATGIETEVKNMYYLNNCEITYPFLDLNTSVFNYMYYYVFCKTDDVNLDWPTEDQEREEFEEKEDLTETSFQNYVVTNHSSFIENLYIEAESQKEVDTHKNSVHDLFYGNRLKASTHVVEWTYGFINKETLLTLWVDIHRCIRNDTIKESTVDLFTYRNQYSLSFVSAKENKGLQVSTFFYNALNNIFIIYISDFLRKNNLHFYKSVLLFDEQEKEISVNWKNSHSTISKHIEDHKKFIQKQNLNQFKQNTHTPLNMNAYYDTIKDKLQYTFLVTYFNNLVFILKSIKYYVDKSLYVIITYLFENAFKNCIENLIILFFKNQNMLLQSKLFYFIKDVLFKHILPYTFLFLTCIFEIDVTKSTEKLYKQLLQQFEIAP